jgi:hypothetical protein
MAAMNAETAHPRVGTGAKEPWGPKHAGWAAFLVLAAIPFDAVLAVRESWGADWVVPLLLFGSVPFWAGLAFLLDRTRRRTVLIVAVVGVVIRVAFMAMVLLALSNFE